MFKKSRMQTLRCRKTRLLHQISAALLLLLFLAAPSWAAASMDVKEAIDLTLRSNSALLSVRQQAVKAEAFRLQADGSWTPEVTINGYRDEQREDQTTDGSERSDNRVARLSLAQTIYSGGRNSALRRQAKQVKSIADLMLIDAENNAVAGLFTRFYNVLLQQERIRTEESAILTSALHLREVTKMGELGLANKLELIRARQQLATNTANLSTAQGMYEAAHIALMNYMAIPPEERRPVVGTLQTFAPEGSREASLRLATQYRADFAQLEEQVQYQQNQIEIEKSGRRPKVVLGASTGYLNPYRNSDRGSDTWRAELSISVPILDRNVTRGNVISAQATLEQDKIAYRQKELDIKSGVETAWTEFETTIRHLESASRAMELAEETLRLAKIGFREGVTPQLDLLAAQTSLTEARLEYLRSLYNHLIAIVALKTTEGSIIRWTEERSF